MASDECSCLCGAFQPRVPLDKKKPISGLSVPRERLGERGLWATFRCAFNMLYICRTTRKESIPMFVRFIKEKMHFAMGNIDMFMRLLKIGPSILTDSLTSLSLNATPGTIMPFTYSMLDRFSALNHVWVNNMEWSRTNTPGDETICGQWHAVDGSVVSVAKGDRFEIRTFAHSGFPWEHSLYSHLMLVSGAEKREIFKSYGSTQRALPIVMSTGGYKTWWDLNTEEIAAKRAEAEAQRACDPEYNDDPDDPDDDAEHNHEDEDEDEEDDEYLEWTWRFAQRQKELEGSGDNDEEVEEDDTDHDLDEGSQDGSQGAGQDVNQGENEGTQATEVKGEKTKVWRCECVHCKW